MLPGRRDGLRHAPRGAGIGAAALEPHPWLGLHGPLPQYLHRDRQRAVALRLHGERRRFRGGRWGVEGRRDGRPLELDPEGLLEREPGLAAPARGGRRRGWGGSPLPRLGEGDAFPPAMRTIGAPWTSVFPMM